MRRSSLLARAMRIAALLLVVYALVRIAGPAPEAARVVGIDLVAGMLQVDRNGETETFRATPAVLGALLPGEYVGLDVDRDGPQPNVARTWRLPRDGVAAPAKKAPVARVGHHHASHHGGVVGMVGMHHVEALALSDGRILAYVSDLMRRAVPLEGASGTVTCFSRPVETAPVRRVETPTGAALEATLSPSELAAVGTELSLVVGGKQLDIEFVLPVVPPHVAGTGIPDRCDPVPDPSSGARCMLHFGSPIAAIDASRDGRFFAVSAIDRPVTTWRTEDGSALTTFDPIPGATNVPGHNDFETAITSVRIRPDGNEVLVFEQNRPLVYSAGSGEVVEELSPLEELVLDAVWLPSGDAFLAATSYGRFVERVPRTGGADPAFNVRANATALALDADGSHAAVGTDKGYVAVVELMTGDVDILASGLHRTVRDVVVAGPWVVGAMADGTLWLWDVEKRTPPTKLEGFPRHTSLAVSPERDRIAIAGSSGEVVVSKLPTLERVMTYKGNSAEIHALAWAGETIVTGDELGRVTLWPAVPH